MKIKEISFKNFASYGNVLQTINFEDIGNFYLVIGENGSGKSSISDAIKFALYGKIGSKRITDVPNRFNNSTYVKIEIEKKKSKIVIERGLSPSFVKLTIDNIEYDQAGKRNVNSYIEEEILEMPFYVFNNIISLSINDFKSFLKMSKNDKRMIIDKIIGLELINIIKNLVRNSLKNIKDNIYLLNKEGDLILKQINKSKDDLKNLKQKIEEDTIEKRNELIENIQFYNEKLNEINEKVILAKNKENKTSTRINEIKEFLLKRRFAIKEIEKKIKLYENKKCPMCESDLTTDFHLEKMKETLAHETSIKKEIEKEEKKLINIREFKSKIITIIDKNNEQRAKFNAFLHDYKTRLYELKNVSTKSNEYSYIEKMIRNNNKIKSELKRKIDTQQNKKNFFKILDEIFGEKGIKQLAIKTILPTLNLEIKKVINDLSLQYKVKFNSEFEPQILHLGHNVSQFQLSTGEKKKIDFAILIALIRLLKIKHGNLNIIFLDELFSSIDSNGIYHILEILSKISKELNMNIFVINHSTLPSEIFDFRIEAYKDNNFSKLNVNKIE